MNAQMIKKIQRLQREMQKTQKEIEESVFTSSANGIVNVSVMGDKTIKEISIKKEALDSLDDMDMLSESIKIAINNAISEINKETEEKMAKYAAIGGMGL